LAAAVRRVVEPLVRVLLIVSGVVFPLVVRRPSFAVAGG
jgi:hypothetical protein